MCRVYAAVWGYDPVAISRKAAVPGDPRVWLIAGDRLFLFYSPENKAAFAADVDQVIADAEREWPSVQLTLSP
jgi:hypothetical protein